MNQLGNIFDTSPLIIKGGHDETYFQVVHAADQPVEFTDYPSIKDGRELHWDHPQYWQHKIPRIRQAIRLTVTGNAVCCEHELKDLGYDAHAIQPTVVMVVIPGQEANYVRGTKN